MQPVCAEVNAYVSRGGSMCLPPLEVVLQVATPARMMCPSYWPVNSRVLRPTGDQIIVLSRLGDNLVQIFSQ